MDAKAKIAELRAQAEELELLEGIKTLTEEQKQAKKHDQEVMHIFFSDIGSDPAKLKAFAEEMKALNLKSTIDYYQLKKGDLQYFR